MRYYERQYDPKIKTIKSDKKTELINEVLTQEIKSVGMRLEVLETQSKAVHG